MRGKDHRLFPEHQIREVPPRGGILGPAFGWKKKGNWKVLLEEEQQVQMCRGMIHSGSLGMMTAEEVQGQGNAGDMGAWLEDGSRMLLLLFDGPWTGSEDNQEPLH